MFTLFNVLILIVLGFVDRALGLGSFSGSTSGTRGANSHGVDPKLPTGSHAY